MQKWLIGIDEAGRGPLAGPVSVGVAFVPYDFDWSLILGVNDSKKLTEKKREEIFRKATELKKEGKIDFVVSMVAASVIDKRGIVYAINLSLNRALTRVQKNTTVSRGILESDCLVKLDGGLKAPCTFAHQETIIGGDGKEKIIGLASIMAKVTRDRYMVRISTQPKFAPYAFAVHKGYGTKAHCEAILHYGISDIHRRSFCRKLLMD